MLHVLKSKWRHSPGRMAVFFLLLALAMTLWCISLQIYFQSVQTQKNVEENNVTVALPQFVYSQHDGGEIIAIEYEEEKYEQLYASESVRIVQQGRTFAGRSEGKTPVIPSLYDRAMKTLSQRYTEDICVMNLTCVGNPVMDYYETLYWDAARRISIPYKSLGSYQVEMRVNEVYTHHPDYDDFADRIYIWSAYMNADGTCPFEKGKTYVVMGTYDMLEGNFDKNKLGKTIYFRPYEAYDYLMVNMDYSPIWYHEVIGYHAQELFYAEDGTVYAYEHILPEEQLFILEEGDERTQMLIELGRLNGELLYITGVNALMGVPKFAMQQAYLVDGRDFTAKESETGEPVCVISAAFAQQNVLQVGDSLPLTLYDQYSGTTGHPVYGQQEVGMTPMTEPEEPVAEIMFRIVGLYESTYWELDKYCFTPNTVFVPDLALPAAGGTEKMDYAASILLKNGGNEVFLEDLKATGMKEKAYEVYDNGYFEYMESLKMMQKDTRMALIVCTLLYLVLTFSAMYMILAHLRGEGEVMRKLGAGKSYVFAYKLLLLLPVMLLAAACAYGFSCLVYVPMTKMLEDLYTLVRPRYSVMMTVATGTITSFMEDRPYLINPLIGLGAAFIMLSVMLMLKKERSETV